MISYKFTGDAYLLGIKLNSEQIEVESSKENISIDKAVQNVIFTVKNSFKSYHNCLDKVEMRSMVILDGIFEFDGKEYDMFDLQLSTTLDKIASKNEDGSYVFFTIPQKIEQLYFMKAIDKDIFTVDDFKNAVTINHNLALFYNDKMVPYTIYHLDTKYNVMKNENYPKTWFNYDEKNKYYTMFDNILQVKSI